jgi:hypothetical protein
VVNRSTAESVQTAIAIVTAATVGENQSVTLASKLFNQYSAEQESIDGIFTGFVHLSAVLLSHIENLNGVPPAETLRWIAETIASNVEDDGE